MSDGFTHEYEASTDEEAPPVVEKPKRQRTPKQQAATAKALEALSKRREEAAAARATKKATEKPAATEPKPSPVADTSSTAAAGAGVSAPNPLAHAVDAKPAFDPLLLAEIVKREIELQKAKERELGWHKTRRSARARSRKYASSSESESEESSSDSYDDRPSRVLQRRTRKPAKIVPDARDAPMPPTDFFDQLMTRHSKFNPW